MWSHLKQLARHSLIYGLGNVATSLLSFLLVPLYAYHLTPPEFGIYALMLIVYNLLASVTDCGLTEGITRYFFDDSRQMPGERLARLRRTLLSTSLAITLMVSLVIAIACYLAADWVARDLFRVPGYSIYLKFVAATLLFRGITPIPMMYLRLNERPLIYTVLTLIQIGLFLALNIVLVVVLNLGVEGIFLSLLLSTGVYALMLVIAVAGDLSPHWQPGLVKGLLRFGLPMVPASLLMWVIDFSDRYLLDLYATKSEVGIYYLGYKFGQAMLFVVTAFTLGWVPIRFKVLALAEPKAVYGRVTTFYIAGAGFVWLALAVFSNEIITLTTPAAFHRAAAFVAPVAFGYLLLGLSTLLLTGVGVASRTGSYPWIVLAAAVLNIALNLLLLPRLGAVAAAYSTLAAYAVMALGSLYFSQRHYPINYEYGRCAALFVGMIILAAAAGYLSPLPMAGAAGVKMLLLGSYGLLVWAVEVFRQGEMRKIAVSISRFSPRPINGWLDSLLKRGWQASRAAGSESF